MLGIFTCAWSSSRLHTAIDFEKNSKEIFFVKLIYSRKFREMPELINFTNFFAFFGGFQGTVPCFVQINSSTKLSFASLLPHHHTRWEYLEGKNGTGKKTATQNSVRLTHHTLGGLLPGSSIFIIFGGKNWDHYFVLRECLKYYDKIYSNFEKIRQSFRSEIQKKNL